MAFFFLPILALSNASFFFKKNSYRILIISFDSKYLNDSERGGKTPKKCHKRKKDIWTRLDFETNICVKYVVLVLKASPLCLTLRV